MRIKKKNVARLASISALGAGALGVAAGTAQAGVVYTPLDLKIGFSPGYGNSTNVNLPGGAYFELQKMFNTAGSANSIYQYLNGLHGSHLVFKPGDAIGGQTWNQLGGGPVSFMRLGMRQNSRHTFYRQGPGHTTITDGGLTVFTHTPSTARTSTTVVKSHTGTNGYFYKLFQFDGGSGNLYGWAYFQQTVSDEGGPDVDLYGVAYDDSGATILAGDTVGPGDSTPEPSTMALTGLAALALGATGLRRWRAARKPAA
jgi:hypothetical protein